MRHVRRRLSAIVAAFIVLMSLEAAAQQRWYETYEDGIAAFRRMQWSAAEEKLKAALALKPAQEQGQRVLFYGTRREAYLPEYYLAQTYLKLGRTKEALDLFAKLEREGRITARDPQYKELKTLVASVPPPVTVVAGGLRGDLGNTPAANGPEGGGSSRGSGGTPAPGGGVPAGAGGNSAPTIAVADNGTLATGTPGAGAPPATGGATRGASSAGGALAGVAPGVNVPPAGGRAAAAPPSSLPTRQAALLERAALQAYFQGNYRDALNLLDNTVLKQNPTQRRLFYLACSNAAIGLLEGDKGRSRITTARAQFAQANGLDSQFAVDRRYISPRILDTLSARR